MKTPLSLVVGRFIALKPRGNKMLGFCPFHADTKARLWVDDEAEAFLCDVCGAYGDADQFVAEWNALPVPSFDELRANYAGVLYDLNASHKAAESLRFQARDNFASRCLPELIAFGHLPAEAATLAYEYADAALIARAPK